MLLRPLTSCLDSGILVLLPLLRDVVGERVVGVRSTKQSLDGEENGADLERGGPVACCSQCLLAWCALGITLTLQDVQADAAKTVDVGVVDLGEEANLWRSHGVVVREEELEIEDAAYTRG